MSVNVDRAKLEAAYQQAERAYGTASDAVRKAEQTLRLAQDAQREAALAVSTFVLVMQELP